MSRCHASTPPPPPSISFFLCRIFKRGLSRTLYLQFLICSSFELVLDIRLNWQFFIFLCVFITDLVELVADSTFSQMFNRCRFNLRKEGESKLFYFMATYTRRRFFLQHRVFLVQYS